MTKLVVIKRKMIQLPVDRMIGKPVEKILEVKVEEIVEVCAANVNSEQFFRWFDFVGLFWRWVSSSSGG